MTEEKRFKNTFAPAHAINKDFTVCMIICGLQQHVFHYKDLPEEVKDEVDTYQAIHATKECGKCHKSYHGSEFKPDGSHD
jgi:hypothetical protein